MNESTARICERCGIEPAEPEPTPLGEWFCDACQQAPREEDFAAARVLPGRGLMVVVAERGDSKS